jgi:cystathionine beta-lyase/cystathionine gamma-synthase
MTKRARGKHHIGTQAVHGGDSTGRRDVDAPVVQPLLQSVNFIQEIGTAEGLRYPRYGNTPNAEAVQRRMAAIEGAEASVLMASGMGATACGLLALLRPGDHIVASSWIYGGTRALLEEEFTTLGIDVSLVNPL